MIIRKVFRMNDPSAKKRWLRFVVGVIALISLIALIIYAPVPPGALGEVLRNNIAKEIDATPIIYSDQDNIMDMQEGVRRMMREAQNDSETIDSIIDEP